MGETGDGKCLKLSAHMEHMFHFIGTVMFLHNRSLIKKFSKSYFISTPYLYFHLHCLISKHNVILLFG